MCSHHFGSQVRNHHYQVVCLPHDLTVSLPFVPAWRIQPQLHKDICIEHLIEPEMMKKNMETLNIAKQ